MGWEGEGHATGRQSKDARLEGAQQDAGFPPLSGRVQVMSQAHGPPAGVLAAVMVISDMTSVLGADAHVSHAGVPGMD